MLIDSHHIGKTPFSLAFGMEAIILTKVGLPTLRGEQIHGNDNVLKASLDWADEVKEATMIRIETYQ